MMNRLYSSMFGLALAALLSLPALAEDTKQPPSSTEQTRELIYCADLMTHEEREAYRASMREASTPQERAEVRKAHQEEMHARARERDLDPIECIPQRQRERLRLRLHGDKP